MIGNATTRVAGSLNRTTTAVVDGVATVVSAVDVDEEGVGINGTAIKGLVSAH